MMVKKVDVFLADGKVGVFSSVKTIANQKTSIFKKLDVKNTEEAVKLFNCLRE